MMFPARTRPPPNWIIRDSKFSSVPLGPRPLMSVPVANNICKRPLMRHLSAISSLGYLLIINSPCHPFRNLPDQTDHQFMHEGHIPSSWLTSGCLFSCTEDIIPQPTFTVDHLGLVPQGAKWSETIERRSHCDAKGDPGDDEQYIEQTWGQNAILSSKPPSCSIYHYAHVYIHLNKK